MATMVGMLVEFKAKSSEVDSAVKNVSAKLDGLQSKNKAVGDSFTNMSSRISTAFKALAVAFVFKQMYDGISNVLSKINETADAIDSMTDKARELGIGAAEFQALAYAAGQSGVSVDDLGQSLSKMSMTLGKVFNGSVKLDFLDVKALKGMNVDQQFVSIIDSLGKIKDKNEQAAASAEFFGRSYSKALSLARDGIRANIEEFNKLGLALTDSQRAAVDAYGDAKNRLEAIWTGFSQKIVAYVAPALTKIVDYISEIIIKMGGIDTAAQKFAQAIVTGVQLAIKYVSTLLDMLDNVRKTLTTISLWEAQRKLAVATVNNPEQGKQLLTGQQIQQITEKPESGQAYDPRALVMSYVPSITNALKTEPLKQEIANLQKNFNAINKSAEERKKSENGLISILQDSKTKIGETYKDMDGVVGGAIKGLQGLNKSFETAAKKIDDTISKMINAAGEKGLNRILKLDEKGEEIKQVQSDQVDNLVKQIYNKGLNGSGGKTLSGTFNGNQISSYETTAAQDYEKLKSLVASSTKGVGDLRGYQEQIGIIDQLKPFVDKVNPQTQKVDVSINVEASDSFIVKVVQSQEAKKQFDKWLLDTTRGSMSMGAK